MVARFDVYLVTLDPTRGHEIQNTRPRVIVSPDEMNSWLRTAIVAPMTTTIRNYPSRIALTFARRKGQVALDQIRTVDQSRLVRRLGRVDEAVAIEIAAVLTEMFAIAQRRSRARWRATLVQGRGPGSSSESHAHREAQHQGAVDAGATVRGDDVLHIRLDEEPGRDLDPA